MKVVEIDAKERKVWLVFEDGWRQAIGHIVKIHGMEFSAVTTLGESGIILIFSSLKSGDKLATMKIDILEALACDTKEKYLVELSQRAIVFSEAIEKSGLDTVAKAIEWHTRRNESKFGAMPEIELAED